MKTTHIKIGQRLFALAFTAGALAELEDRIEGFDMVKISETARNTDTLLDVLTALAREGEYLEGRELDVDRRWFGAHISPAPVHMAKLQVAVLNAFSAGFAMEAEMGDDDNGEVDVVLEELKKKETKDSAGDS